MSESSSSEDRTAAADQPPVSESDAASLTLVPATGAGLPPTAQTFFAVVNSNGTLVRGFGVLSSTRLATGQYQVVFNHDITGSAYVGTTGFTGSVGVAPAGQIAVVGRFGLPNGVFVETFNGTGAAADRAFHLAVHS